MRTNKERLRAYMEEHFINMKADITNRMRDYIGNDNWHTAKSIKLHEVLLMNMYFTSIDWQSEHECKDLAWIRPDIIGKGLAVPVGSDYYGGKYPLPYRRRGNAYFEILYAGEWVDAQSGDWDLSDTVPEEGE
jgi:hypothetical protein